MECARRYFACGEIRVRLRLWSSFQDDHTPSFFLSIWWGLINTLISYKLNVWCRYPIVWVSDGRYLVRRRCFGISDGRFLMSIIWTLPITFSWSCLKYISMKISSLIAISLTGIWLTAPLTLSSGESLIKGKTIECKAGTWKIHRSEWGKTSTGRVTYDHKGDGQGVRVTTRSVMDCDLLGKKEKVIKEKNGRGYERMHRRMRRNWWFIYRFRTWQYTYRSFLYSLNWGWCEFMMS